MKLTQNQLKRIICEELESTLNEMTPPPMKSDLPGPLGIASDLGRGLWWAILAHLEQTVPESPKKAEMIAAVEKEAEKEERGYPENPNNPTRMAEKKNKKWIQGADLKKGRCTPMGTKECPEGSPQYNLANRFKGGDIHKDNLKKGKNPHGPGE